MIIRRRRNLEFLFLTGDSCMRRCKTGRVMCGSRRDDDTRKRMLPAVQVEENRRKGRSARDDRNRGRAVLSEHRQMVKSRMLRYSVRFLFIGGGKNRDRETEVRDVESRPSDVKIRLKTYVCTHPGRIATFQRLIANVGSTKIRLRIKD